jgi:hypothetical protein
MQDVSVATVPASPVLDAATVTNGAMEKVPAPPPPAPKRRARRRPSVEVDESKREYITNGITAADVLMGRGGFTNNHRGNQTYLEQKKALQPRYQAATKEAKTAISEELVAWVVARGGRFLKRDAANKPWYVATSKEARNKASQTLREDNTPEALALKRAKYPKKQPKK